MNEMPQKALKIADEVLLPAASEVDRTGRIPDSHFRRLAEDGFYGLVAPPEFGGPGVDFPDFLRIIETLASACLTTAFTWLQHHGVVMGLAMTPNAALREKYLGRAASGQLRGGGAFSGVIPDPPRVRATRVDDGWSLHGDVTFVSGWGIVDVLHVSAYDETSGDVVSGLIEARAGNGIVKVQPLDLVAAQASNTVRLVFDDLHLADDMVTTRANREEYLGGLAIGLRVDSSLALGLIQRAAAGLDSVGQQEMADAFRAESASLRARFDAVMADPSAMPAMRAECSALAVRACTAFVVAAGGRSLLQSHDAQRLARESLFTLVVASRPAVKTALLGMLDVSGAAG
ncbi:acyl-CoA dehydrogenase family protein [Kibdelosporangium persicum]|uniref:Acyl-CoA dehydrogenase n=1 Tax=Kibdelosporangium persicum TaxID=2698649 RepID=A0ABX2F4Y2_9PSEU|nr:acyl-CoA dehydrogenase family protein [Kibdelosporangium persicum]NRN66394.1 Acyl-CoA dehydrogenase [Kibdelosporangium persicum]